MTRACVILAAGEGTRLRSSVPKVFHEVGGRSMLLRAWSAAAAATSRGIVVAGPEQRLWEEALEGSGAEVVVQEERRGTGDALARARPLLEGSSGTLLVTCGDVPLVRPSTLERLLAAREEEDAAAVVLTMIVEDPSGYGRILRGGEGGVLGIVEESDADHRQREIREVNSGLYAFRLPDLWKHLEAVDGDNAQGEIYLTDVVRGMRDAGSRVLAVQAEDAAELMGVNTRGDLAVAEAALRDRNVARLQETGVTVLDPATTWIEDGVRGAPDVVLHPGVILQGEVVLAEGASVGPWSRLRDCRIGKGARVLDHCVLEASRLAEGAVVGPFTRMRQGAEIGEAVQVGNFVEVKASRLGAGTKAKHLAYLGNATVGPGVNVGAGTITCNHDGYQKHATTLGEGAYIGSNATLVAPVTVGRGAYVAAGSTITDDVPPGALGLGRCRQTVKDDWADERRARREEQEGG